MKIKVTYTTNQRFTHTKFLLQGGHVPSIVTESINYTRFIECMDGASPDLIFSDIAEELAENSFLLGADNKTAFATSTVVDFIFEEVKEEEPEPEQDEVTAVPTPEAPNMQQVIEMLEKAQANAAQQQQGEPELSAFQRIVEKNESQEDKRND